MKIRILLFLVLILVMKSSGSANIQESKTGPLRILFIGSSYFNSYDLPGLFEGLCINSGRPVIIDGVIFNGWYLSDHAESTITEAKINEQQWDYVILQGVGVIMAYPDYHPEHAAYPALVTLKQKILNNCPASKMLFCLPWAFEDGMTWVGWPDDYNVMQNKAYYASLAYADEIGFSVAPVGWAWKTVLNELDFPLHYLHMPDWNHPSIRGSYLMACVIYSSVFLDATYENRYTGGLLSDDALYFQNVSDHTVLDSLDLWNLDGGSSIDDILPDNYKTVVNYPNPFNNSTTVIFRNPSAQQVKLELYDTKGSLIRAYPERSEEKGECKFDIKMKGLDSGTYIIRLTAGSGKYEERINFIK